MPSRTPSNGLETANQKETFQSEVVEFIFTLFSQAFEDEHFTEREISFETLNEVRRIWIAGIGLEDSAPQKATVTRLRNTRPESCAASIYINRDLKILDERTARFKTA